MFSVNPCTIYGNKGDINIPFLRKRHGKICALIQCFKQRRFQMRKRNGKLGKPYDSSGLALIETKELEFGHFHQRNLVETPWFHKKNYLETCVKPEVNIIIGLIYDILLPQ